MAVQRSTFANLASKFLNDTFADFAKDAVINELVTTDDLQGGRSESFEFFSNVKCFIFPLTGKENVNSGRYFTDQNFKFQFKPVDGLNTKMKIEYNGNTYGIISIEDLVSADVWMEVITEINPAS